LEHAKQFYVSQVEEHQGHITRMTLILDDDPFSKQSIVSIDTIRAQVRDALPESIRGRTTVSVLGPTASLYDVRTTAEQDRQSMYIWVTIVVLVILILLLRKLVVSIYLVATVILTYLTTMGVTYLVFMAVDGSSFSGLQWTVPTLLFTLLMAVGADYNVLLVERFEEEKLKHGAGTAAVRSLASTGGLISGAGIVMAGTFLALNLGGTLDSMQQLGFALAFGVLIDTFLVRPLLVPSFLLLFIGFWKKTFGSEKREKEGQE
jgi:RND superfamily putative drug exporter